MDSYDSSSAYSGSSTVSSSGDAGLALMFMGIYLLVLLAIYVVFSIFLGMIFKKAGIASWKAWVPVYNTWVMLEMGGQKGWLALLAFIPGAGLVTSIFLFIAMYHIGLKLQKEGWFVLLAIFLPFVWVIWLALDKSTWQENGYTQPSTTPQPIA